MNFTRKSVFRAVRVQTQLKFLKKILIFISSYSFYQLPFHRSALMDYSPHEILRNHDFARNLVHERVMFWT